MTKTKAVDVGKEVERRIAEARRILEPTEVRLHRVPKWLRLLMLQKFGCRNRDTSGGGVLWNAVQTDSCGGWLDHWGSTMMCGKLCFVSEPYNVTAEKVADVDAFAARLGVQWSLSANSWWYPGHTVRIVLWPPE